MSSLEKYAAVHPHLAFIAHLPIEEARHLVVDGSTLYVGARDSVHRVDVTDFSAPRLVCSAQFKGHIGSLAVAGKTLLVGENERAVNLVDVSKVDTLDTFDCVLSFGTTFYQTKILGNFAVAAMNWDGVGLLDVRDPRKARWLDRMKLDNGFVEHIALGADRIFAAGASDGLRVLAIENEKLVEVARPFEIGFNASKVFSVGDRIWVVGTPPKVKGSKRSNEPQLCVIDPRKPDATESTFELKTSEPGALMPLANGAAVGFSGYTCLAYSPDEKWGGKIFKQFTNDVDHSYAERPADQTSYEGAEEKTSCMSDVRSMNRRGNKLVLLNSDGVWIFETGDASIFRS